MELTTEDQRVLRDFLEERKVQLDRERPGVDEGLADLRAGRVHVYKTREEILDDVERLAQQLA